VTALFGLTHIPIAHVIWVFAVVLGLMRTPLGLVIGSMVYAIITKIFAFAGKVLGYLHNLGIFNLLSLKPTGRCLDRFVCRIVLSILLSIIMVIKVP